MLKLRKCDCTRQLNEHTREYEYRINLRKETLKRSRRARSELTNYRETVEYLDLYLKTFGDEDVIFDFGASWAKKFLLRAVTKVGVRCLPAGTRPTLKDLRSSMACDLLSKGWSRDEVNARLGHAPSSKEIDDYINFLALDRNGPKQKVHEHQIGKLVHQVTEFQEQNKLLALRLATLKESSERKFQHMARVLDVHSRMAVLGVQHCAQQLSENEYLNALRRLTRQLEDEHDVASLESF
jgi:hypothetical protein